MYKFIVCLACGLFWAWANNNIFGAIDGTIYVYGQIALVENVAAWLAGKLGKRQGETVE